MARRPGHEINAHIEKDSRNIEQESLTLQKSLLGAYDRADKDATGALSLRGQQQFQRQLSESLNDWEARTFDRMTDSFNTTLDKSIDHYSDMLRKKGFDVPPESKVETIAGKAIEKAFGAPNHGDSTVGRTRKIREKTRANISKNLNGDPRLVKAAIKRHTLSPPGSNIQGGTNSKSMMRVFHNESNQLSHNFAKGLFEETGVEYVKWVLNPHYERKHCETCVEYASGGSALHAPKIQEFNEASYTVPSFDEINGDLSKLSTRDNEYTPPTRIYSGVKGLSQEEEANLTKFAKKYNYNGYGKIDLPRFRSDSAYRSNYRLQTYGRARRENIIRLAVKKKASYVNVYSAFTTAQEILDGVASAQLAPKMFDVSDLIKTGGKTRLQAVTEAIRRRVKGLTVPQTKQKYTPTDAAVQTMRRDAVIGRKIFSLKSENNKYNGALMEDVIAKAIGGKPIAGANNPIDVIKFKMSGGKITEAHLVEAKLTALGDNGVPFYGGQVVQQDAALNWRYKLIRAAHISEVLGLPATQVHYHQLSGIIMGNEGIALVDCTPKQPSVREGLKVSSKGTIDIKSARAVLGMKPSYPIPLVDKRSEEIAHWFNLGDGMEVVTVIPKDDAMFQDFRKKLKVTVSKMDDSSKEMTKGGAGPRMKPGEVYYTYADVSTIGEDRKK